MVDVTVCVCTGLVTTLVLTTVLVGVERVVMNIRVEVGIERHLQADDKAAPSAHDEKQGGFGHGLDSRFAFTTGVGSTGQVLAVDVIVVVPSVAVIVAVTA